MRWTERQSTFVLPVLRVRIGLSPREGIEDLQRALKMAGDPQGHLRQDEPLQLREMQLFR